ncbi:MAG: polymer-forming cytoskeletal protein [Lachnospiraceae bacterium]|nr:polymer-forming cytoskeletal protein [Lachnospiraceae bacterium]
MGFFKDFKRDFAQAVNELMPDKDELADEYDDEDMVNTFDEDIEIAPEDIFENVDEIGMEDDEIDNLSKFEAFSNEPEEVEIKNTEEQTIDEVPEVEIINGRSEIDLESLDVEKLDSIEDSSEHLGENVLGDNIEQDNTETIIVDIEDGMSQDSEVDELVSLEELDNDDMLENTEDALSVEPEKQKDLLSTEQNLEDLDLKKALEDAINKLEDETESNVNGIAEVVEDDMEDDMTETLISEEMLKERENDINSVLSDDTTYITKGTVIKGDIEADGGIDVIGTVEGNVKCGGKLIIGGSITGKVEAGEIYANAAKLEGDINTEGSVKIGVGSVVVGNVFATSAVIAGAVNGDIDVHGPVIVDSTAVIMGNIKSRSVQINNGAVIEGFCSQCYSEIDVKSFFE